METRMVHGAGSIPARVLEEGESDEVEDDREPITRRFVLRGSRVVEVSASPRRETR